MLGLTQKSWNRQTQNLCTFEVKQEHKEINIMVTFTYFFKGGPRWFDLALHIPVKLHDLLILAQGLIQMANLRSLKKMRTVDFMKWFGERRVINLKWENTKAVTCDAREVVLKDRTRSVTLLQEKKEIQQTDNRIWSEFLLMVLLFVNQNASVPESSGSRDYEKHSCRYIGHSCKQLLEHAVFTLLLQKTTLHSVREARWSTTIKQSVNTTLLGRVRENAQPAAFSVGWKIRRTEYLGRERSMQEMWEGECVPPRTIKEPVCCHCNITYKTQAQSLMSLSLKIRESLSCLRVLVCSECAVLFPKAFHLKVSFRQPVWDRALWNSMAKEQGCMPFNFNKSWEKILFSLAEFILSDL